MRGTYNRKTGKYEINGKEVMRPESKEGQGYTLEEIKELEEIEKIEAEGGTYLHRYAEKLGVSEADLLKNILANNSFSRFNSVKSYHDFTMLKQTLVEETGPMAKMKEWSNAILGDRYFGGTYK